MQPGGEFAGCAFMYACDGSRSRGGDGTRDKTRRTLSRMRRFRVASCHHKFPPGLNLVT